MHSVRVACGATFLLHLESLQRRAGDKWQVRNDSKLYSHDRTGRITSSGAHQLSPALASSPFEETLESIEEREPPLLDWFCLHGAEAAGRSWQESVWKTLAAGSSSTVARCHCDSQRFQI